MFSMTRPPLIAMPPTEESGTRHRRRRTVGRHPVRTRAAAWRRPTEHPRETKSRARPQGLRPPRCSPDPGQAQAIVVDWHRPRAARVDCAIRTICATAFDPKQKSSRNAVTRLLSNADSAAPPCKHRSLYRKRDCRRRRSGTDCPQPGSTDRRRRMWPPPPTATYIWLELQAQRRGAVRGSAGIIGAGRSWTAAMISVLSIPRKYRDVIARSACPSCLWITSSEIPSRDISTA